MMALASARARMVSILLLLVVLLAAGVTWSASPSAEANAVVPLRADSAGYDLSWWTVDGGGCTFSSGGVYTVGGTIGQPDAGALTGGGCTLGGGFWGGGAVGTSYAVHLPLVIRSR